MNIYFVCTGNTCRSPMAEAILRAKKSLGVNVRSAGIYAMTGGDMSENAKKVLTEEQLFFPHVSKQLTAEEIGWADLLLTMTTAHRDMITRSFPEARNKTFTLKEYVAFEGSKDVSDPFGGDVSVYRQTFQELTDLIDTLEKKWLEE